MDVSGRKNILIKSMNINLIIFTLNNVYSEILPDSAIPCRAKFVATGRSSFPNQINKDVVFPAVLRSFLNLRIKVLNEKLIVIVAKTITSLVDDEHLKDYIIPQINHQRILHVVTQVSKGRIKKICHLKSTETGTLFAYRLLHIIEHWSILYI